MQARSNELFRVKEKVGKQKIKETERKKQNEHISSAARMLDNFMQEALERIQTINEELNIRDNTKNKANARKKMAKYNMEAETPPTAFYA